MTLPAALLLSPEARQLVYADGVMTRLQRRANLVAIVAPANEWQQHRAALAKVEVLFSGWGAPVMEEPLLAAMPRLRAIFYAGGSVRYFATEALWQRGITVTTAAALNAVPVAEYTVAAVLLGLKRFWHYVRVTRDQRTFPVHRPLPGAFHSTVGLIAFGTIGRLVRERLRAHDVKVLVHDPFLTADEAREAGVERAVLDEVFAQSDVVSLHAPLLPQTIGMIRGHHFAQMKPGALFINTARGEIVHEGEMISALQSRPDLYALLDVTATEPPLPDSPLYALPNVILTPHIAGSLGPECQRMGHAMVDEFERYLAGEPLKWELTPQRAAVTA